MSALNDRTVVLTGGTRGIGLAIAKRGGGSAGTAPTRCPTGELTLTLKVKRNVIYERYAHVFDALYATREPAP